MASYLFEKKHAKSPLPQEEPAPVSPMAGGMPSLVDGASRKDLPEAMRTKMENAFGADFSNLRIYESEKVAEGGAKAVTQGNTIAFAPGQFNVYSPSSEALLGHELSHVVSQARGESRGSGLVDNAYLEAKADREGVMAAAGQTVYNGPLTPISSSTPMSVAGPMQCKEDKNFKGIENVDKLNPKRRKDLNKLYQHRLNLKKQFDKKHKNGGMDDGTFAAKWNSDKYFTARKNVESSDYGRECLAEIERMLPFQNDNFDENTISNDKFDMYANDPAANRKLKR